MCGIVGALLHNVGLESIGPVNRILDEIMEASAERGRDGYGYTVLETNEDLQYAPNEFKCLQSYLDDGMSGRRHFFSGSFQHASMIANLRAEPTTEFVKEKQLYDQQPYSLGDWSMVHNGTIANDKELRTMFPARSYPSKIDSAAIIERLDYWGSSFRVAEMLKGSFAILIQSRLSNTLDVICNYRPIWYIQTQWGIFFASSKDYLPEGWGAATMVEPYSYNVFRAQGLIQSVSLRRDLPQRRKILVVCSGGLDSVVAATKLIREGNEVELIHYTYGSRAEDPEWIAVQQVAEELNVPLNLRDMDVYEQSDSPLLQADSKIAGGEEGAEFAHEWVPARNLIMLALTTGFAEANGFDAIALGNNLEEAGAYPDNEPEFINRFNALLPFAVADGKQVTIEQPVGNLMKHEIVALGLELGAPLHLTWSCYRAGEQHCGTCGPCFMRRTAFEINEAEEVIEYEN